MKNGLVRNQVDDERQITIPGEPQIFISTPGAGEEEQQHLIDIVSSDIYHTTCFPTIDLH